MLSAFTKIAIPAASACKLRSCLANSKGTLHFRSAICPSHSTFSLSRSKPQPPCRFRPNSFYFCRVGRTPVWTAFVTHHVTSSRWIREVGSKTIHLADLQRYVFSSEYVPQLGSGGEHELVFMKAEGMWALLLFDVYTSSSFGS